MELNEQDKERIVAEEKLRMETRKDYFKENFGGMHGMGRWGGGWHGYGGHCYRYGGFGFLKGLLIVVAIFALFHLWHRPYCGWGPGYYGYPAYPAPQSAPAPQPPAKN
jgi:hypothetical protein